MIDSSLNKQNLKRKLIEEAKQIKKSLKNKKNGKKLPLIEEKSEEEEEELDDDDDLEHDSDDEITQEEAVSTYNQEVLCKDNLENDDLIQLGNIYK